MTEQKFTLYWLTGDREVVSGQNAADAMTKAGYSHGSLPALDFWEHGDNNNNYEWSQSDRRWVITAEHLADISK
jgi:hypothetical protein